MLKTLRKTGKTFPSKGEGRGGVTHQFQIEHPLPVIPHLECLGKNKPRVKETLTTTLSKTVRGTKRLDVLQRTIK